MELYRRTDEVLHYLWDPIGVAGAAGARDEYDSYLPSVHALVSGGADRAEIAELLLSVAKNIGVGADLTKTNEIADILIEHREWIEEMRD